MPRFTKMDFSELYRKFVDSDYLRSLDAQAGRS